MLVGRGMKDEARTMRIEDFAYPRLVANVRDDGLDRNLRERAPQLMEDLEDRVFTVADETRQLP